MKYSARLGLVVGIALLYGLITRLIFGLGATREYFPIVSLSFLILMPISFGALTTFLGYRFFGKSHYWFWLAPMAVSTVGLILSIVTHLEAVLCVVVATPLVLPFSVAGGALVAWIYSRQSGKLPISLIVLAPFAIAPIESLWHLPHEEVSIQDSVVIHASPSEVWRQIVSVPAIRSEEIPFQWIYLLDFPRPISAEIDREGIGAKRRATFERGVSFFEVITEWIPLQKLSFSIEADPAFIPHTAFDQHIIVGGRFYDVLDGSYEIQRQEGGCRLVLTSRHRLSSPFNSYAGVWSRWVMNQIQGSILTVIKQRCESASQATAPRT